jgi:zinc transport system substrate-binding protein
MFPHHTLIIFIIIAIMTIFTCNCKSSPITDVHGDHIVIASILPLSGFAEKVGGKKIKVFEMVPPGASPHTYEPTPGQLEKVSKAGIYLSVGSGIEFEITWLDKIMTLNDEMILVDCSKGIELIGAIGNPNDQNSDHDDEEVYNEIEDDHNMGGIDPHIWLSPINASIMVENIYLSLSKLYPEDEDIFYDNKKEFQDELEMLDRKIREILRGNTQRKIIVFHPGWSYFARDYGLEQIVIEKEGKEPSPRDMVRVIDLAKDSDIKIIFASPEFSPKSAEVIADEIGGNVVLISPLAKDYIENLIKITEVFEESIE